MHKWWTAETGSRRQLLPADHENAALGWSSTMGYWSQRQIEEGELHVSLGSGETVCEQCVGDEALKEFVRDHLEATECSFCDRSSDKPIATDVDGVLRHISVALQRYYTDPLEILYFDGESDSGFAGPEPDYVEDLIEEDALGCPRFAEFVHRQFGDSTWVKIEPYVLTEREALSFSWEAFSRTVKHETRFLFALSNPRKEEFPDPGAPVRDAMAFLNEIGNLVREFGLVRELGPEATLYRVRVCDADKQLASAKDIGAPPAVHASQSRMSPAGIPMVYTALERETALAETLECPERPGRVVWTGEFHVRAHTRIVDLSLAPEIPSFFDLTGSVDRREKLRFLHEFRDDLSKPIERDGLVHVNYVPTQVITEYLRRAFKTDDGEPVFGLQFASSRDAAGHNVVVFLNNEACVDLGEEALRAPTLELRELSSQAAAEICGAVQDAADDADV